MGQKMMRQRRAVDGGWNYGNRIVLGEELPSYPETTGLALVGMLGCKDFNAAGALAVAQRQYEQTRSPLARAWLAIALRNHDAAVPGHGAELPETEAATAVPPRHVHLAALEALAAPGGNHALFAALGVA
jgi:hypothetical protein